MKIATKNDKYGSRAKSGYTIHETEFPQRKAELAQELICRFGLVACTDAGTIDEAGRSRLRLLTPVEVVDRATQMADYAWSEFERLGWVLHIPPPEPINPTTYCGVVPE